MTVRKARTFSAGDDPRALRDAFGCFATGVTVVTAMGPEDRPVGLTANSFTSVSLDPPLLLVCLSNASGTLRVLEAVDHFAVNVLHAGQQSLSEGFAQSGQSIFDDIAWHKGLEQVPLLDGALVHFECRRHAMHDGGDHIILIGQVEGANCDLDADPLVFFKGKYSKLQLP